MSLANARANPGLVPWYGERAAQSQSLHEAWPAEFVVHVSGGGEIAHAAKHRIDPGEPAAFAHVRKPVVTLC